MNALVILGLVTLGLLRLIIIAALVYLYFAIRQIRNFNKTHSKAVVESWWTHYPVIAGSSVLTVAVVAMLVIHRLPSHY